LARLQNIYSCELTWILCRLFLTETCRYTYPHKLFRFILLKSEDNQSVLLSRQILQHFQFLSNLFSRSPDSNHRTENFKRKAKTANHQTKNATKPHQFTSETNPPKSSQPRRAVHFTSSKLFVKS